MTDEEKKQAAIAAKKAENARLEGAVLDGSMSIVDFCVEKLEGQIARMKERNPDLLWTLEIQYTMWNNIKTAHERGKKCVFYGGPVPVDIIKAFDCQPVYLDVYPIRLSPNTNLCSKFIDSARKFAPSTMCGIDAVELGISLEHQYGAEPDAFVYSSLPCDSSRLAYPPMEHIFNCPCFSFDTPFRRDERGLEYLIDQTERFVKFMEDFTGKKLDWDKLKESMIISNRTFELQGKAADTRKRKPCTLPGRMLLLNGCSNAMCCFPEMGDLLEKEIETADMLFEFGMGPCPDGEKHRAVQLQNMIWSCASSFDWMEKTYNTVVVMDAFGFQQGDIYEHLDDRHDCFRVMAKKMQNNPMIHGASGPTQNYIDLVEQIMDEYDPDVSLFMGHVGCKHTWASAKIITDLIQEKYGLPSLYLDIDGIDGRYKSQEDIQNQLAEYFDTVVNK